MATGDHLKGNKPPTSGRAPGQKNHRVLLLEDILSTEKYQKLIDDGTFISPLSFWLEILHDDKFGIHIRNEAAKSLAKYLHKVQPTIIEQTIITEGDNAFNITFKPAE